METISVESPQPPNFFKTWVPLATAAALTGTGSLAAYTFELGRAGAYGIPPTLVRPDATTLLSFTLAMIGVLVVPAIFFVHATATGEKQVLGRPVGVFIGVTAVLLALSPILTITTRVAHVLLLAAGVIAVIAIGIWVANRIGRNLQQSSSEHRLVFQLCLCAIAVGVLVMHLFWSGWRWERTRVDHLVLRTPDINAVVARVYGSEMVCAEIDKSPKLTGRIFIVKTGEGVKHPLVREKICLLRTE